MSGDRGSGTRQGSQAEGLSFADAMSQLEGILRRIESEEVDVDQLAEELKRASELVELCRAKIKKAEMEIDQVVEGLEGPRAGQAD